MRLQRGVCKILLPEVVVTEAHQMIAAMYATWRTSKDHKTVKIGGWALVREWVLAWDNTVSEITTGPS